MEGISKKARNEAKSIAEGHGLGKKYRKEIVGDSNLALKLLLDRQASLMEELLAHVIDLELKL